MKKVCVLIATLLCAMLPIYAYAAEEEATLIPSDITNGLIFDLTLSDYVAAYNKALLDTVPKGDSLLYEPDQAYIDAAKAHLIARLANPNAVTIHDARIYEIDAYGRFCVWFDVTETAAFETFARNHYYVFIQALKPNDIIAYVEEYSILSGEDPEQIQQYRSKNEFGVDLAEKAVKAYLQTADMYEQEATIRLSPDEVYYPYRYAGRAFSVTVYTEASSDQVAGMLLSIGEEQLRSFPMAERITFFDRCLTAFFTAAREDDSITNDQDMIKTLFDTTRLAPSGDTIYEDMLLYGCTAEEGVLSFIVMPVSEDVYSANAYWWVDRSMAYLVEKGKKALDAEDYDSAIWRFEEVGFSVSTYLDLASAYYKKAEDMLSSARYDQAIALFKEAGSFGDASARIAEAYYAKGDALYSAGDTAGARDCFALAGGYEDAHQRYLSCSYWLGEDALTIKDYDTAIVYFEQAAGYLDASHRIEQIYFERGELLAQAGNEVGAAKQYEHAKGYLSTLGDNALKAQDYDGAIDYYEKAGHSSTSSTNLGKAYYMKAEDYLKSEKYDQAIDCFTKAGNFQDAQNRLKETYYRKGSLLYDTGNVEEAKDCFALAGEYENASQRYLSCCYWIGEKALAEKNFVAAEANFISAAGYLDASMKIEQTYYERAEQLTQEGHVTSAAQYYDLARNYITALGDAALAEQDYDAAILYYEKLDYSSSPLPSLGEAYYRKAEGYLKAEQHDQAIDYFTRAETFEDAAARVAETFYQKGDMLYSVDDIAGAKDCFVKAGNYSDANERVLSCCYMLGEIELDEQNYAAAEAYFVEANGYQDADMRIKQVHYEHAEQLMSAGNESAAISHYERATGYLDADDRVAAVFYGKAEVALANGDNDAATGYFRQAGDYLDSEERLTQIADKEHQQAFEQARQQCAAYFSNPVDSAFPSSTYAALSGMNGYGESKQLMQKLDETKRLLDVLGVIGTPSRGVRVRDYFEIKEVAKGNDRVALEIASWFVFMSYDTGFLLEASLDRSTYTISSWTRGADFVMYGDESTLDLIYRFSAMIVGNDQADGALTKKINDARWERVGNSLKASIFSDGYKLDFALVPTDRGGYKDFSIIATKNAY